MQVIKTNSPTIRLGLLLVLVVLTLGRLSAQGVLNQSENVTSRSKHIMGRGINLPTYDDKKLHYGFFLAVNYSTFNMTHSNFYLNNLTNNAVAKPLVAINPIGGPGFTTGFILNARYNDIFDIRILPTVSFYTRYVECRFSNDSIVNQLNQSTFAFLELPILLKYKSQRRHNTRMYMIGGVKPSMEVGSKRDEIGDTFLRTNTSDFAVEYGFGFDFYYPLFKFSPEIRFSHGLLNMKYADGNIYAKSIKDFYTHTVTIYLNFE